MTVVTRHFPQRSTGAPASAELDVVVKRQWPPAGDGMEEDTIDWVVVLFKSPYVCRR